jgi:hypothetical protein
LFSGWDMRPGGRYSIVNSRRQSHVQGQSGHMFAVKSKEKRPW